MLGNTVFEKEKAFYEFFPTGRSDFFCEMFFETKYHVFVVKRNASVVKKEEIDGKEKGI